MLREVDVIQGLLLHAFLQFISLFPISYIHGKILFNRAYAAVLGTEMRRRNVISGINMATAQSLSARITSGCEISSEECSDFRGCH